MPRFALANLAMTKTGMQIHKMWAIEYETATSLCSSIRLEVSEFVKIIIKYQVPNKKAE